MSLKDYLLKLRKNVSKEKVIKDNIIEENEKKSLNEEDIRIITKKLEEATLNFFPKEGNWKSHCFQRPKELGMGNLPCHLRNSEWLAKMLIQNQDLFYISYNRVLDFVKNSVFFQEKRHEYELEIVKWQINFIVNHGEGWLCDDKYGGDIVYMTPVCDLGVRKGVVDTLLAIGMDREVIEEGIEKNADLWRDFFMESAFRNKFEPVFYSIFGNKGIKLEPVDPEHKENWLKMRKYEYYCDHKKSVDKYGIVEPEMLMSQEELKEITKYLEIKNAERLDCIEQYKEKRYGYSKTLTK